MGPICYPSFMVRRLSLLIALVTFLVAAGTLRGETFKLNNGESVTGEALIASGNDTGIQIKVAEGEYQRVPWTSFSQEDLKKFKENKKLEPFVEPFIEITQEEKIKRTEVNPQQPPRLELPPKRSVIGALFSSSVGLFVLFLIYAANLYAAFEIALFRARPIPLVCGVSAVLPIIGPIIFLSMKTDLSAAAAEISAEETPPAEPAPADQTTASQAASSAAVPVDPDNPMAGAVAHPSALHIAHTEAPKPQHAPATTYQRGQFTFNRRFFETKFPGFFGVVRRDAEKDMVLVIKAARGHFIGTRITRIAANDLHLEVHRGNASEEVMIPFQEIQEIQVKHKDA